MALAEQWSAQREPELVLPFLGERRSNDREPSHSLREMQSWEEQSCASGLWITSQ